jgi:hypothetical protein
LHEIKRATLEILSELEECLADIDREIIIGFIDYSEEILAIDTLCEQLSERNCILTPRQRERLLTLVSEVGMDRAKYERIVPQSGGASVPVRR